MIYLDNAATTFPKPMCVKNAANTFFTQYGGNPGRSGHKISIDTAKQVFETRGELAKFFNAETEEDVVFTLNCTYASNIVINGLLKKGDHAIISDMEHNSVSRPIYRLYKEGKITYDVAKTYDNDVDTFKSFAELIKPNTKLIATTHASNILGSTVPIEMIGNLCHETDIFFMVDAAQSAGVMDIDIKRDNIDFLCIAGHKGLYAVSGTGILITNKGTYLSPLAVGGSGSISASMEHPDFMPDLLECGTANTLGIITIKAGLKFINYEGRQNLYTKEINLSKRLYEGLASNKKVILYSSYPEVNKSVPVIAFNVEGHSSEETCVYLDKQGLCLRGGLHCAPLAHNKVGTMEIGMARASLAAFNNIKDVDYLIKTIKNL